MHNLEYCRKKIDIIDKNIVKLLLLRFKFVKRIASYKKGNKIGVLDKKRELQVIAKIKKKSGKKHQKFIISVFKNIIDYSKKMQFR